MPVEIRELIIKSYVDNTHEGSGPVEAVTDRQQEKLQQTVREDLEQILDIIREQQER